MSKSSESESSALAVVASAVGSGTGSGTGTGSGSTTFGILNPPDFGTGAAGNSTGVSSSSPYSSSYRSSSSSPIVDGGFCQSRVPQNSTHPRAEDNKVGDQVTIVNSMEKPKLDFSRSSQI